MNKMEKKTYNTEARPEYHEFAADLFKKGLIKKETLIEMLLKDPEWEKAKAQMEAGISVLNGSNILKYQDLEQEHKTSLILGNKIEHARRNFEAITKAINPLLNTDIGKTPFFAELLKEASENLKIMSEVNKM